MVLIIIVLSMVLIMVLIISMVLRKKPQLSFTHILNAGNKVLK